MRKYKRPGWNSRIREDVSDTDQNGIPGQQAQNVYNLSNRSKHDTTRFSLSWYNFDSNAVGHQIPDFFNLCVGNRDAPQSPII